MDWFSESDNAEGVRNTINFALESNKQNYSTSLAAAAAKYNWDREKEKLYKIYIKHLKVHKVRVCHITTVHRLFDVRIFHRMCCTLSSNQYEVHLIGKKSKISKLNNVYLSVFLIFKIAFIV